MATEPQLANFSVRPCSLPYAGFSLRLKVSSLCFGAFAPELPIERRKAASFCGCPLPAELAHCLSPLSSIKVALALTQSKVSSARAQGNGALRYPATLLRRKGRRVER